MAVSASHPDRRPAYEDARRWLREQLDQVVDGARTMASWLATLREMLGAGAVLLTLDGPSAAGGSRCVAAGFDDASLDRYARCFAATDPFTPAAASVEPGRVATTGVLGLDDATVEGSDLLRDFLRPRDLGLPVLCVALGRARRGYRPALLRVFARAGRGPFGTTENALLASQTSALARVVPMLRRVHTLELERDAALAALDHHAGALFVCDRVGTVIQRNRAAARLVAAADGLTVRHGCLCGETGEATAALRRLVRDAPPSGDPVVLPLPRRSGGHPLGVTARGVLAGARVMVSVSEPRRPTPLDPALLRATFGLTPAETALAQRLADGLSLADAARLLGVSKNTARSHLRALFEKTATTRQAELTRTLLLVAGIVA